jgi:hypothetical protein
MACALSPCRALLCGGNQRKQERFANACPRHDLAAAMTAEQVRNVVDNGVAKALLVERAMGEREVEAHGRKPQLVG